MNHLAARCWNTNPILKEAHKISLSHSKHWTLTKIHNSCHTRSQIFMLQATRTERITRTYVRYESSRYTNKQPLRIHATREGQRNFGCLRFPPPSRFGCSRVTLVTPPVLSLPSAPPPLRQDVRLAGRRTSDRPSCRSSGRPSWQLKPVGGGSWMGFSKARLDPPTWPQPSSLTSAISPLLSGLVSRSDSADCRPVALLGSWSTQRCTLGQWSTCPRGPLASVAAHLTRRGMRRTLRPWRNDLQIWAFKERFLMKYAILPLEIISATNHLCDDAELNLRLAWIVPWQRVAQVPPRISHSWTRSTTDDGAEKLGRMMVNILWLHKSYSLN